MTTIALGMEVETSDARVGLVVASPRDGKGWLVACDDGKDRRYREENLMEYDACYWRSGYFRD